MPIKTLEPFLFENYSVGNYPIDILKNSTIGIDLSHYVSRLLTFKKEPFIELIGGFPITLLSNMENDLKIFNELNIKPIFVINGLCNQLDFSFKTSDGLNSSERVKLNRWEYSSKNMKIDTFRDYHTPLNFNVFDIIEFFNDKNLDYLIAPYHSSEQLYYMLQQNIIDVIYASTDLLLFPLPLEKYIFCIEFQNREFKFLDKAYILNRLNINEKQFVEIAMCCGNDYQPFKLNIFQPGLDINFQQLHDFVINGGSIYNSILQSPFQDKFFKGLSMLKFHPILTTKGSLEIYKTNNDDKLPNDLHDFIGQKLSNEYYYYQSLGITDFKLVETILFGTYLERLSPDCNPHPFYVSLINDVDLVNNILNLSTNFMHRYYQFKKYDMKLILPNETRVLPLTSRLPQPLYLTTRKYLYKSPNSKILKLDEFCQNLTENIQINTKALSEDSKLSNNAELLGSSITRSLYLLDLIDLNGELINFGKLLPIIKSKEAMLFVLFLARFHKNLKKSDFGLNKFEILNKILSIYHVSNVKPINYTNKISQNLLQFNSIFSKLQDKFNELIISNLLTILFNNEFGQKFQYQQKDWYQLVNSNPFNKQFNSVLMGLLSESFFQNFNSVENSINTLNGSFLTVFVDLTPYEVLKSGFEWFNTEFMDLITKLNELELLPKEVVDGFNEANTWLKENVLV